MQGERAEGRAPEAASHPQHNPALSLAKPLQLCSSEAELSTKMLAFQNETLRFNYFLLLPVTSSLS